MRENEGKMGQKMRKKKNNKWFKNEEKLNKNEEKLNEKWGKNREKCEKNE